MIRECVEIGCAWRVHGVKFDLHYAFFVHTKNGLERT